MLLQIFTHQAGGLAGLNVAAGLQLGIEQFAIDAELEAPAIRRHQADLLDLLFESFQQFGHQTDGPVGVMSDGAILKRDFKQHGGLHFVQ